MILEGWEFHLLNNAFLCHWGFQTRESLPIWRGWQIHANEKRFVKFVQVLRSKYGQRFRPKDFPRVQEKFQLWKFGNPSWNPDAWDWNNAVKLYHNYYFILWIMFLLMALYACPRLLKKRMLI